MLREIDQQHKRKATALFQEIVINDVMSLHDFIIQLYKHFKSCGEGVQVNGPRHDTSRPQLAFSCPKCRQQWRFPRRTPKGTVNTFPLLARDFSLHSNTSVNPKKGRKRIVPDNDSRTDVIGRLDPYFPISAPI